MSITPQKIANAPKSRTVWLGLAVTILGYFQANVGLIRTAAAPYLDPTRVDPIMGLVTMGLGVAVIVVRFYTDTSLDQK